MPDQVVHIIDDDEAVRHSLAFLLQTAGHSALTYESAVQFLATPRAGDAGCVVTDIRMPDMTGLDLVRRLREKGSSLPVIIITGHGDVPLAVEAMKAGVRDFLEKPFDEDAILAAVASALDTDARLTQQDAARRRFDSMLDALSPRERDVLQGVVAGKPNKVIAYDLGISPRTVEVYRANVMTKTGAASLSELVRMALLAEF